MRVCVCVFWGGGGHNSQKTYLESEHGSEEKQCVKKQNFGRDDIFIVFTIYYEHKTYHITVLVQLSAKMTNK